MNYFLVAIAGWSRTKGVRNSRIPITLYLSRVTFKDGDGSMAMSKIWYVTELKKAQRFSKLTAEALVAQLKSPVWRSERAWVVNEKGEKISG
jgi:hypothetical protein